jgi:hypothetical protein
MLMATSVVLNPLKFWFTYRRTFTHILSFGGFPVVGTCYGFIYLK